MISWPAIIKYHGDDELAYVATESEWNNDADLSAYAYDDNDALIDNNGRIYQLNIRVSDIVVPRTANNTMSLYQLIKLVQTHAALQGECCIEKIVFKSITEGIQLVASMSEGD